MLKVSNLTKTYDTAKALDDVSFEIKPGDITGFLGPNGAGKTTTLRIITGYLIPDSGAVTYDNKELTANSKEILGEIGYLPEENPLYGNLRVDEFLLYTARLKNASDLSSLKEITKKCGLESVMTKNIDTLSKGFKQRVGFAKALIGKPKFLIMDEPTEGLDPNQKEEILKLIKDIAQDTTIIFSSHVLSEVRQIANNVIIINKGKIVAQGNSDKLIKKHFKNSLINIRTDAPQKKLDQELKKVKTIFDIKRKSEGRAKFSEFEVSCTNPENTALEIYKVISKNRWGLVELHSESQGLEELFKELTK
ncbi:MAG: ATP-binding cassette domain-containing protein [Candidatus Dojkabacteria bacterium]|nr:ATP-binding cassette domain-containing protein [Candidatus Dojkabacteria bacterium]